MRALRITRSVGMRFPMRSTCFFARLLLKSSENRFPMNLVHEEHRASGELGDGFVDQPLGFCPASQAVNL